MLQFLTRFVSRDVRLLLFKKKKFKTFDGIRWHQKYSSTKKYQIILMTWVILYDQLSFCKAAAIENKSPQLILNPTHPHLGNTG